MNMGESLSRKAGNDRNFRHVNRNPKT
jgi:hypothetical protein